MSINDRDDLVRRPLDMSLCNSKLISEVDFQILGVKDQVKAVVNSMCL